MAGRTEKKLLDIPKMQVHSHSVCGRQCLKVVPFPEPLSKDLETVTLLLILRKFTKDPWEMGANP